MRLLVHTHDSFKSESEMGVPITDPKSHASLACAFLAGYCDDIKVVIHTGTGDTYNHSWGSPVTESGEPLTTMALPAMWCIDTPAKSSPKPLGVRADPALTVRPSS